ncbi:MAG: NAD(+)/NADH kinase [Spirochaetes bacterium]|nr:NAD(+)/NADH kinase [Spirochaetota bacterium]
MFEYAIIVRSKTRRELLQDKFQTHAQAKFYVERSGGRIDDIDAEHDEFYRSLEAVQAQLSGKLKFKIIDRGFLPSFIFAENQLIITVGQDGLVANTAKYAKGQPIIGVNPDPERFDGVLLKTQVKTFAQHLQHALTGAAAVSEITMAELKLNDGQRLLAFNDFFIGPSSHISARYIITQGKRHEEHSSSGILISTGAGKTGWMSSVLNMVAGISGKAEIAAYKNLAWSSPELIYAVREPFISKQSQAAMVWGIINSGSPLVIESRMAQSGVIFSDGIERDFLHFNSGAIATVGVAAEKARLVTG